MLTTTHILVGAAVAGRPNLKPWQIALAWFGGLAPDFSVFVMVATTRMPGAAPTNMWRQPDGLYWSEPWQTLSAISNSMPLYALGLIIGIVLFRSQTRLQALAIAMMVFCAAALLHVGVDFLVHTDDAHVHFWPFTEWRFHSAVSYYQRDNYGTWVSLFEMVMGFGIVMLLFRRFKSWWVRGAALFCALPYLISIRFLF